MLGEVKVGTGYKLTSNCSLCTFRRPTYFRKRRTVCSDVHGTFLSARILNKPRCYTLRWLNYFSVRLFSSNTALNTPESSSTHFADTSRQTIQSPRFLIYDGFESDSKLLQHEERVYSWCLPAKQAPRFPVIYTGHNALQLLNLGQQKFACTH